MNAGRLRDLAAACVRTARIGPGQRLKAKLDFTAKEIATQPSTMS